MKEHTYLNGEKKAKTLALVLTLCAVASVILAYILMGGMHSVLSTVLFGLGALISIALACFAIHYINYNNVQGQSVKAPTAALHAWAVHGIFMIAALLVGKAGTFSFGLTHALLDGSLAAILALLCCCFANRKPGFWLPAIAAAATAVLSLLEIHIAVELLLIVLAVLTIVIAIRGFKLRVSVAICTIITALAVLIISVIALIKGNSVSMHMMLHVITQLAMLLVACAARSLVKTGAVRALNNPESSNENDESKKEQASIVAPVRSAEAEQSENFVKAWINKRAENLSPSELLSASVDSLYGVSSGDAELLKAAFGIKTIGDLADNKFFAWAQEIVSEAKLKPNQV